MVCLCLLLMIGGMVGLQGGRFFKGHQFRLKVQHLKSEVRILKLLASSLDADFTLIFRYDGRELTLDMETDEKVPYLFKPLAMEVDECLLDNKPLEEVRVLYSRSRQAVHEIEITLDSDHLIIKI